MMEDPLPGQMKKQLVLKIISGQQLPKPKDSMLGDRGEVMIYFSQIILDTDFKYMLKIHPSKDLFIDFI